MSPLLAHVHAQQSCIQALLDVLDREDEAISGGRFAELSSIREKKAGLLEQLAQLDRNREEAQAVLGFERGRAGAQAAAAHDETLRPAWVRLMALAEKARDLNQRVGAKVYTHLAFTQKAIGFLQARGQPIYGPDGAQETPRGGGASLASA